MLHHFFTRIFVSFWVAIVLIAAGAAALTAINFASEAGEPEALTRQASEVLQRDGLSGLRVWLAERNRSHRQERTLVVDASGQDILGQQLPEFRGRRSGGGRGPRLEHEPPAPTELEPPVPDANAVAGERPHGPRRFRAPPSSAIHGPDGAVYYVLFDPPPRRGPFAPPFSWSVRAGLLALALTISGLVSYLLARSISSPVRLLQTAAHTLSTGNLAARAGPQVTERKDEFGVLGREFDSMAERLSALIAARQRLLRDISHELRSPLARMEMAIGLARQDPVSTPDQLDRVEREAERLDRLIGHILEYARLERDPATFTFEETDLVALIQQIVHDADFESQSPAGRLRFTHDDEAVVLNADPNVLHAAIDNVVRNALLHGDTRMPIKVALTSDAEQIQISVRDNGPGVPEADLVRIFEPFYRAGSVDSKHVSTEGTGIGLAITQRAAALHGGRVAARNAEGGGLLVTITLPRTSKA